MIFPSVHLIFKQCHNQWRSSLFRTIVVINRRQLATTGKQKQDSKVPKNDTLVQSTTDNQIEVATFKEKGRRKKRLFV
jgi:hypothetical protein